MDKVKKKALKKSLLVILSVIVAALLAVIAVMSVLNISARNKNFKTAAGFNTVSYVNKLIPEKDSNGNWCFITDRDFKIMQITDVHIGGGCLSVDKDTMALNAVAAMVTAEKPDLVIVTGDIAFPVPFMAGTINNKAEAKIFASLMESLGVYWAPVYGNHDTESYSLYNRKDISEFYGSSDLKYCLFDEGDEDADGYGNREILIKNSKGIITQALILFDSHSYAKGSFFGINGKYDNMHENQIEWYKKVVSGLNAQNAEAIEKAYASDAEKNEAMQKFGTVPSLAFYHIPSEEYMTAWKEYCANGRKDTENVKWIYGTTGESGKVFFCGDNPDNLFETMLELGSTKGIFCGHDHLNNFSIDYKGIRLTYGYSIDYLAYSGISKIGSQRGCTLITVSPDGTFTNEGSNYYQDKYPTLAGYSKETVEMQDLDESSHPDDPIYKLNK